MHPFRSLRSIPLPPERLAFLALLLGAVAIGCSPLFVRLSETGPIATAFWRVVLALLPLQLLAIWQRQRGKSPAATQEAAAASRPPAIPLNRWYRAALLGLPGVLLAGDLATWHISLHMTSVTNSTLITNIAPIFVTLGAWLLLGQSVHRLFLVGMVLAMAGVLVLKSMTATWGGGHLGGDAMAVIAAVFYAGYMLLVGVLRGRYRALELMGWSTLATAVTLLPVIFYFEAGPWLPRTAQGWLVLLGLAWISHVAGQGLIAFALAWLPASFSSLTLLIQPVVAAVLAWLFLQEPITGGQALGGALVLSGIVLARRSGGGKPVSAPSPG